MSHQLSLLKNNSENSRRNHITLCHITFLNYKIIQKNSRRPNSTIYTKAPKF
jgi:hypothetical protein